MKKGSGIKGSGEEEGTVPGGARTSLGLKPSRSKRKISPRGVLQTASPDGFALARSWEPGTRENTTLRAKLIRGKRTRSTNKQRTLGVSGMASPESGKRGE